jgi:ABC-type polysaccharide/polyol phosphate export permease
MFADLTATIVRWRTWALMAGQDILLRYRRSVLGPFWISISMAALILAIGYLYSAVMHLDLVTYLSYLAFGLLAWNFLSSLLNEGCNIVIEAEGHLRSVAIPTPVLAARMVYRNLIIFLHNAVVVGLLIIFLARYGFRVSPMAPLSLVGVLIYLLIGYFAAIALGPLCARFRDIPQVIANVLQVAFFLSPIIWGVGTSLAGPRALFKDANPFYHLLQVVRGPLLGGPEAATPTNWLVSLSILGVLFVAALATLALSRRRIYLWL